MRFRHYHHVYRHVRARHETDQRASDGTARSRQKSWLLDNTQTDLHNMIGKASMSMFRGVQRAGAYGDKRSDDF